MKVWKNRVLRGNLKFIGVDLAWGFRRPSPFCIIRKVNDGFRYEVTLYLTSLEDFASFFRDERSPLCLAIDAPLTVINQEGNRRAEREIAPFLRQFRGGILPVNLSIVEQRYPNLILFWKLLAKYHFQIALPFVNSFQRIAFEVFPPLTVLGLWGGEVLATYRKAKKGGGFSPPFLERLCDLESSHFPLPLVGLKQFLLSAQENPALFTDTLDALLCAYTACYLWARGREYACIFGTPEEGKVVMPLHDAQRALVNLANSRA